MNCMVQTCLMYTSSFFSQTNNMSIPSPINKFKIIFLENEELEHV